MIIVAKISPLNVLPLYTDTTFMRNYEFRITRINTNKNILKILSSSTHKIYNFFKQTKKKMKIHDKS